MGAGLSIAAIGRTLAAIDHPGDRPRTEYLHTAVAALSDPVSPDVAATDTHSEAERQVDELLTGLGWDVDPASPGRNDLIATIEAIHRFLPGLVTSPRQLEPYAHAVHRLADVEIPGDYDPGTDPEAVLRYSCSAPCRSNRSCSRSANLPTSTESATSDHARRTARRDAAARHDDPRWGAPVAIRTSSRHSSEVNRH